jgi:predicted PurR-regulated permease PerM
VEEEGGVSSGEPSAPDVPPDASLEAPVETKEVVETTTDENGEVPLWLRRAIALFFLWAIGIAIAYWALDRLRPLIIMLVIALFLSLAMEPPVKTLAARGWRRGAATGLVVVIVLLISGGFLIALGSVLVDQITLLVDETPRYVRNIVRFLNDSFGLDIDAREWIRDLKSEDGPLRRFQRDLSDSAPDIGLAVAEGLLQVATTLIFAFYMTADGPRFRRTICSRLPRKRQEVVLETWELAIEKTGAYLYSRALLAVISALFTWLFLLILGVPSPLALAIWVGVVSQFVPTIGNYIAMLLPGLVTLVDKPRFVLFVLGFLVLYQQFENYVLGPRIARFTLKIHPALTIGTVFAGGYLFGAIGAVLALPATAVIQGMLSTYTEEHRVVETELTKEPRKRRRRFVRSRTFLRRLRRRDRAGPSRSG